MESKAQNQSNFFDPTTPTPLPLPPTPPNPPQCTNLANIGPIWMELGVKVKNGEESSNPKLIFRSDHPNPLYPLPPTPLTHPTVPTLPIFVRFV